MSYRYHIDSPIGVICIEADERAITRLFFDREEKALHKQEKPETDLLKKAGEQLMEYFSGKRKTFDLPLAPSGTEFQKKVWKALCQIPYGETRSYGEIAAQIGNPKACRAVGGANNKNPIMIFIPCHRVIGADGSLVGFGGGIDAKKFMLNLAKGAE